MCKKSSYLREECPICKQGALEILNYTAVNVGESYYTAECTNCHVVFDKLSIKDWHEDKTWDVIIDGGNFSLKNQDDDIVYDLSLFEDVVRLSVYLNKNAV